jgi:uncharacterized repeat protein (TIGR01451 family)
MTLVRPRRTVPLLLAALAVLPLAALSACGASSANLTATLTAPAGTKLSAVRPGSLVPFVATVVNHGPGQATGVTLRIDLPGGFRYQSTTSVDTSSVASRTQPSDPPVDTAAPLWGQWSMGAPGVNADGTPARSVLTIGFLAKASGKPGDYNLTPHAFSEGSDEVVGKQLALKLLPASDLTISVAVDESTAKRGDLVHYHVSVINRGSGQTGGVGVLVTLPGGIVFNKTEHLEGNYSRNNPVDPISGALVVYYGGWVLPPSSAARPGSLNIVFSAKVLPTALGGRYPVTAQLTDTEGAVLSLNDTAPVTVNAPTPTPSPPPSPSPSPTPTRKP